MDLGLKTMTAMLYLNLDVEASLSLIGFERDAGAVNPNIPTDESIMYDKRSINFGSLRAF